MLKKKILLIGSNDRASLACARSLSGTYNVYIARFTTFKNVTCYSNTVIESYYVGEPSVSLSNTLIKLEEIHDYQKFDFILPVTDEALIVVEQLRNLNNITCNFLIPDKDSLDRAQDKYLIRELCEDIPEVFYPETKLITNSVFKEIDDYKINDFPIYLKTRKSNFIIADYIYSYNVKKINNGIEFNNYLRDVLAHVDVLLQTTIEGKGLGLNVLSTNGVVVGESVNERIHEPNGGGGGVYRRTRKPSMTESMIISKIVKKLNWTGPLMIELKETKKGWCLIELNCRFWGSLSGTIFSGHDYPLFYTKMFECEELINIPAAKTITSRNLLKDLSWTVRNKNIVQFFKLLISPIDVLMRKDIYDVERLRDIKPSFMQFLVKLMQYNIPRKINRLLNLISLKIKVRKVNVLKEVDIDRTIIFICRGNVNRSVFAKHYFEKLTSKKSDSRSTLRLEKRKCSILAQTVALSEYSIDLSEHSSKSILGEYEQLNTMYVCMDYKNILDLLDFGVPLSKMRMLSSIEIKDPHGCGIDEFKKCFQQISSSIEGLFHEF